MSKTNNRKHTKTLRTVLYIFILFIVQESLFRLGFPLPEIKNLDRKNYLNWHPDVNINNHLRNQKFYWQSEPDTNGIFKHNMNRYGFRDKEWLVEKGEDKKRAIFIGDSFVEGLMAEQVGTITEGFKKAAGEQNYEVLNAGMMGMGLNSYLQLLADIIPIFKPDIVFFCIYANDLGQKQVVSPDLYLEPEYYKWYKPRLIELFQQYSANGAVLFRWDNRIKPFLQKTPIISNPWTKDEKKLKPHVNPILAEAMKNGKFNPYRTNALIKEERHLKKEPKLGETIPFVQYFCNKFNVEPVVIYIPSRNQVTNYYHQFEKELCLLNYQDTIDLTKPAYQLHQQIVAKQCKDFNVRFIDLTEDIKEREAKGEHLYWNYDEHMRAKGYLLLGKTIWDRWKEK